MSVFTVKDVDAHIAHVLSSAHTQCHSLLPSVSEVLHQMRRIFTTEFTGQTLEDSLFNELQRDGSARLSLQGES